MKLSKHSKMRLNERANLRNNEKLKYYKIALKKGKTYAEIENEQISEFLKSKEKWNCHAKLYDDKVFIYSKNNKQLYTMYKLPDEYRQLL